MTREEIKIGKAVWFYPLSDSPEREAAVITSNPFDWCGCSVCCNIDIRTCVVDIENLEPREENVIKVPLTKDELIAKLEAKQKELSDEWYKESMKEDGEWKTHSKADDLYSRSKAYKECIEFLKENLV